MSDMELVVCLQPQLTGTCYNQPWDNTLASAAADPATAARPHAAGEGRLATGHSGAELGHTVQRLLATG